MYFKRGCKYKGNPKFQNFTSNHYEKLDTLCINFIE